VGNKGVWGHVPGLALLGRRVGSLIHLTALPPTLVRCSLPNIGAPLLDAAPRPRHSTGCTTRLLPIVCMLSSVRRRRRLTLALTPAARGSSMPPRATNDKVRTLS
jgi:hypothetical protein